ncbi:hypothetical protein EON63_01950 [archaeon]|nr:MAG: hypothetical protein EON63_01950 [archaeon]
MVRGDNNLVKIGTSSHIQDRAVVTTVKTLETGFPADVNIGINPLLYHINLGFALIMLYL